MNLWKAVTQKPSEVIKRQDEIGSMNIGIEADVTILKLVDADEVAEDSNGNKRTLKKKIIPVAVFRAGVLNILKIEWLRFQIISWIMSYDKLDAIFREFDMISIESNDNYINLGTFDMWMLLSAKCQACV